MRAGPAGPLHQRFECRTPARAVLAAGTLSQGLVPDWNEAARAPALRAAGRRPGPFMAADHCWQGRWKCRYKPGSLRGGATRDRRSPWYREFPTCRPASFHPAGQAYSRRRPKSAESPAHPLGPPPLRLRLRRCPADPTTAGVSRQKAGKRDAPPEGRTAGFTSGPAPPRIAS
jgi:hypothetical protein